MGIGRATRPQTNDIMRKSAKNHSERKNQRIRKIALPETKSIRLLLKALTDHFGGGSRVVSFDPYS